MQFDVYRKRGRNWEYLGEYDATDSRKAALRASYAHNIKVIGVKPAYSNAKLFVYRLQHVATLTSA